MNKRYRPAGRANERSSDEALWGRFLVLPVLVLASVLAFATPASAQPNAIFLARHAERAATSGHVPSDTGLSQAGHERAQHLAQELRDAQISMIFTSEYKRTQETA